MGDLHRGFTFCGITAGILALMLGGCSEVKPYSEHLPENLHVVTHADSGSSVKSLSTELDIHLVDSSCHTHYKGRVYLDHPSLDVGVPSDHLLYLDFIFASKTLMSTTTHAVRYSTLLTSRAGYTYEAKVSYDKGIYNVVIKERHKGNVVRVIPRRPLQSCRSGA